MNRVRKSRRRVLRASPQASCHYTALIDRGDMQESQSHMVIFPNSLDMPFVRFREVPCAEISLVELGDYTCPICRQAAPVVHSLLEQFPGRILFGYWHFPIKERRPDSELASEACEVAAAQGRFWEYSDMMFERSPSFDEKVLIERAAELGLDVEAFREDLSTHRYLPRVQLSVEAGRAMGIRSTPSFLVNGQLLDASFGLRDLRGVVRAALGESQEPLAGRSIKSV